MRKDCIAPSLLSCKYYSVNASIMGMWCMLIVAETTDKWCKGKGRISLEMAIILLYDGTLFFGALLI